jgi:hypothetical protein
MTILMMMLLQDDVVTLQNGDTIKGKVVKMRAAGSLRNEARLALAIQAGWSAFAANVVDYDTDPPLKLPRMRKADILWLAGLRYSF